MKIVKTILLIAVFMVMLNACEKGCLKCDKATDKCLSCDVTNGYHFNADLQCEQKIIEGCIWKSQNGVCLRCEEGSYYDGATDKCNQIENEEDKVKHCYYYKAPKTCEVCKAPFYLNGGICTRVSAEIQGCVYYSGDSICDWCEIGSVLTPDQRRCAQIKEDKECLFYGYMKCDACKEGYVLDYSYFVDGVLSDSKFNQTIADDIIRSSVVSKQSVVSLISPCRELAIKQCVKYKDHSTCDKCADFFYLSDKGKECLPFPLPAIPQCLVYSNHNECVKCVDKFLLASPQECKRVEEIEHCVIYDQGSSANVCIQCIPERYVSGNICVERQVDVEDCQIYNYTEDKCSQCITGKVLTSDHAKCLPEIANCKEYIPSNLGMSEHQCLECKEEYVYMTDDVACDVGSVDNCKIYPHDQPTTCNVCKNGFYFDNNECLPHNEIKKCKVYSTQNKDSCLQCENSAFLTQQITGCAPITADIPFCLTYDTATTCEECESGYYVNNGSCRQIPPEENCINKDNSNNCIQCKSGYLLISGACEKPSSTYSMHCEEMENDGFADTFECISCKENTVPFLYKNSNICKPIGIIPENQIKENCVQYEYVNSTYKCTMCEEGYIVRFAERDCVEIGSVAYNNATKMIGFCPATRVLGNQHIYGNYSMLFPFFTRNFEYSSFVKDNFQGLTCIPETVPITTLNSLQSINPKAKSFYNYKADPGLLYPSVSCVSEIGITYKPDDSPETHENCKAYDIDEEEYFCIQCEHGYTGKVLTRINNFPFIQYCDEVVQDCDASVEYGGLFFNNLSIFDNDYMILYSCHKCQSENKIPVMFTGSDYLVPYGMELDEGQNPDRATVKDGVTIRCLEIKPESFKIKEKDFVTKFPENCGLAAYNTDQDRSFKGFITPLFTLICTACKTGHKATVVEGRIISCEPIKNCDNEYEGTQYFNGCAKCQNGFAWSLDLEVGKSDYSRCIKVSDPNCRVAHQNTEPLSEINSYYPSGKCFICNEGYSFNIDGVCELIEAPNCKKGHFYNYMPIFEAGFYLSSEYFSLIGNGGRGCSVCEDGFVPITSSAVETICTESSYLKNGIFASDTRFIENCKNYTSVDSEYRCAKCKEGYISSENSRFCISQDVYPNCSVLNDDNDKCVECSDNFVLVDGFCEKESIKNCKSYAQGEDSQICTDCIDTYKLVNNKCIIGHVENCKAYEDDNCLECMKKHVLADLNDNKQTCLPINDSLYCNSLDRDNINNDNLLSCTECVNNYVTVVDQTLFDKFVCMDVIEVENCISYDVQESLGDSSLNCTQCSGNYFLKNNHCYDRKVSTLNCIEYSLTDDFCVECGDGFYLSNEKDCKPFPTGIFGCIDYVTHTECGACDKGTFLNGTSCTVVTQVVPNCDYYSDNGVCRECKFTYYLTEDNTCVKAKALNCKTYERIDRCSSCLEEFGLAQDENNGNINCMPIPSQNCADNDYQYPFECHRCMPLFYLEYGNCISVTEPINNCIQYDSANTCKVCAEGTILSINKRYCYQDTETDVLPFTNCADAKMTVRPICNVCKPGNKMVKGICTPCQKHSSESGCMFCANEEGEETCLMCFPGYYQLSDGTCESSE